MNTKILSLLEKKIETSRIYNLSEKDPFTFVDNKPVWKSRKYDRIYWRKFLKMIDKFSEKNKIRIKIRFHSTTDDRYELVYGNDCAQYKENLITVKVENSDFSFSFVVCGSFNEKIFSRQTKDMINQISSFSSFEIEYHNVT